MLFVFLTLSEDGVEVSGVTRPGEAESSRDVSKVSSGTGAGVQACKKEV